MTTDGPIGKLMRAYYGATCSPMSTVDRIDAEVCWKHLQYLLQQESSRWITGYRLPYLTGK